MRNEFVPYDIALAMVDLGFNYKCFKRYDFNTKKLKAEHSYSGLSAPLYQQAFRWFREVHNIEACVSCFYNDKLDIPYEKREYHAFIIRKGVTSKSKYKTYEEAEIACLRKLIEIVKND